MIAPTPFSAGRGTHLRILHEAIGLQKKGHQITIVTYHIGDTPAELVAAGVRIVRIPRLLFWYAKREAGPDWQKIPLDILLCATAIRVATSEKPDIIHGHLHEGVAVGWLVRTILFWQKMKLVGDFHGTFVGEMTAHGYLKNSFLKKIFQQKEKVIHKMPDRVCTSMSDLAVSIGKDRSDVVLVVSDASTVLLPAISSSEKQIVRLKYKIPDNAIVVLYTGGFTKDKGIDVLVSCARMLSGDGLHWIFAGFSEKGFPKTDLPAELLVQIISPLSENTLTDLLLLADIAVDPKQDYVGQGSGKLMNYMNAGLPTVCFDSNANRDVLGEKMRPLLANGEEEFTKIIRLLAQDSLLRGTFASLSKERSKLFSWEESCAKLEKLYE